METMEDDPYSMNIKTCVHHCIVTLSSLLKWCNTSFLGGYVAKDNSNSYSIAQEECRYIVKKNKINSSNILHRGKLNLLEREPYDITEKRNRYSVKAFASV